MAQISKRNTRLKNLNQDVGKAYHVSKNGVLTVNLQDEHFQEEFIKQLRRIKAKREKMVKELQEKAVVRHA